MNTEDKIFNKIKNAAQQGEKDFSGMDKVWARVEEKLDNQVVIQKKNTWQKLAVAASVLLVISITYQYLKPIDKIDNNIINITKPVVNNDLPKVLNDVKKTDVATTVEKPKLRKTNLISTKNNIVFTEVIAPVDDVIMADATEKLEEKSEFENQGFDKLSKETDKSLAAKIDNGLLNNKNYNMATSNENSFFKPKVYEARTANYDYKFKDSLPNTTQNYASKKERKKKENVNSPLILIDGKLMPNDLDNSKVTEQDIKNFTNSGDDTTLFLPDPLYIINGEEYTEESLFGKKPTSPYYPLSKQKITSTSMLSPAEATKIYGKKGEKGIVIITTKGGVPLKK